MDVLRDTRAAETRRAGILASLAVGCSVVVVGCFVVGGCSGKSVGATNNSSDNANTSPCGNGQLDGSEECDGAELGGQSCQSLGLDVGTLGCTSDCTLDHSGCRAPDTCGDGVVDPGEVCDDGNDVDWDGCGNCVITDIRVNSMSTECSEPDVATAVDGSFVVAWRGLLSSSEILVRQYAGSGHPLDEELELSAGVAAERRPAVGMAEDGRFVVTWEGSVGPGEWAWRTYVQPFDASGSPADDVFESNSVPNCEQARPDVAMAADGRFVLTFQRSCNPSWGDADDNIFAQRFDSAGALVGDELQVNTYTADIQSRAGVAVHADGSFIVVWQSNLQDGEEYGVFGQRFDATGNPQGGELQVNTYTAGWQTEAQVATASDGRFVVVWDSKFQDGDGYGVFGQRFDAIGTPLDGELQVNAYTAGDQEWPAAAAASDGRYVVVWHSERQDHDGLDVFGQRFDAIGARLGGEFRVNIQQGGINGQPAVAMAADGRFVVVWSRIPEDGEPNDRDIYMQRFDRLGNPLGVEP
ncbi:MAG: DUF4215 domain-containing protein [bacterium]